jgi:serine/threonine protein phosphatase PrpC
MLYSGRALLIFQVRSANDGATIASLKEKNVGKEIGEDASSSTPTSLTVADGVGGYTFTSAYLSMTLSTDMAEYYLQRDGSNSQDDLVGFIMERIREFRESQEEYLQDLKKKNPGIDNRINENLLTSGTTLMTVELQGDRNYNRGVLRIFQKGDSLMGVFRPRLVVNSEDEEGYVYELVFCTQQMQYSFNYPHQFTSSDKYHTPSESRSSRFELKEGDLVLLGTDGLFDNLSWGAISIMLNILMKALLDPNVDQKNLDSILQDHAKEYFGRLRRDKEVIKKYFQEEKWREEKNTKNSSLVKGIEDPDSTSPERDSWANKQLSMSALKTVQDQLKELETLNTSEKISEIDKSFFRQEGKNSPLEHSNDLTKKSLKSKDEGLLGSQLRVSYEIIKIRPDSTSDITISKGSPQYEVLQRATHKKEKTETSSNVDKTTSPYNLRSSNPKSGSTANSPLEIQPNRRTVQGLRSNKNNVTRFQNDNSSGKEKNDHSHLEISYEPNSRQPKTEAINRSNISQLSLSSNWLPKKAEFSDLSTIGSIRKTGQQKEKRNQVKDSENPGQVTVQPRKKFKKSQTLEETRLNHFKNTPEENKKFKRTSSVLSKPTPQDEFDDLLTIKYLKIPTRNMIGQDIGVSINTLSEIPVYQSQPSDPAAREANSRKEAIHREHKINPAISSIKIIPSESLIVKRKNNCPNFIKYKKSDETSFEANSSKLATIKYILPPMYNEVDKVNETPFQTMGSELSNGIKAAGRILAGGSGKKQESKDSKKEVPTESKKQDIGEALGSGSINEISVTNSQNQNLVTKVVEKDRYKALSPRTQEILRIHQIFESCPSLSFLFEPSPSDQQLTDPCVEKLIRDNFLIPKRYYVNYKNRFDARSFNNALAKVAEYSSRITDFNPNPFWISSMKSEKKNIFDPEGKVDDITVMAAIAVVPKEPELTGVDFKGQIKAMKDKTTVEQRSGIAHYIQRMNEKITRELKRLSNLI